MGELIDTDDEENQADIEQDSFSDSFDADYNEDDERSLVDSDEEREVLKCRKAKEAKINNSFTGPYPVDPTDFNHTDKGPNF